MKALDGTLSPPWPLPKPVHTPPVWLLTVTAQRMTSTSVLCMREYNDNTLIERRMPSHSTGPAGHQWDILSEKSAH